MLGKQGTIVRNLCISGTAIERMKLTWGISNERAVAIITTTITTLSASITWIIIMLATLVTYRIWNLIRLEAVTILVFWMKNLNWVSSTAMLLSVSLLKDRCILQALETMWLKASFQRRIDNGNRNLQFRILLRLTLTWIQLLIPIKIASQRTPVMGTIRLLVKMKIKNRI